MSLGYSNNTHWITTTTRSRYWDYYWDNEATSGIVGEWYVSIGIQDTAPIAPFQERDLDYRIDRDRYSYAENNNSIKVDKGSPAKARYAVFYAVNKDPVIFCRTRMEMIKEVKNLLKRKEVDPKSIRIFALIGGAKAIKELN
jgi:hypothetical protein